MNKSGLSSNEVLLSKQKFGSNSIQSNTNHSFLKLFIESLGDPIIKILLLVLGIKTVFLFQNFDWFETLGIVIAILIASLISTISEYGSERAFQKLQEESSKIKCTCIRDGILKTVNIDEIVVGDLLKLSSGELIPADGILIEGKISVDESSFTGETKDIEKKESDEVYRGSVILNGGTYMKVTKVGLNTKYGKIAEELQSKTPDSPLKIKLRELASTISKIGTIGAILVFFSYLFSIIFIETSFDTTLILKILTTPKILFGHIIYALTLAVTIIIVSVPDDCVLL